MTVIWFLELHMPFIRQYCRVVCISAYYVGYDGSRLLPILAMGGGSKFPP